MNIKGKKVTLRAVEERDLEKLHQWNNDPDILYQLGGWHFPSSMENMQIWYNSLRDDKLNQRFAIEVPDLGLIGTANLVDIDWKNNHGFHGIMIGDKDCRGLGYGVDTVMTIMRYAFEELHFERLDGSIIEYNKPSLGLYCKACGWKQEGILRKWYYRKNQYWDKILVGITRSDYQELINKNNYWEVK